jgi:hypothetical protein
MKIALFWTNICAWIEYRHSLNINKTRYCMDGYDITTTSPFPPCSCYRIASLIPFSFVWRSLDQSVWPNSRTKIFRSTGNIKLAFTRSCYTGGEACGKMRLILQKRDIVIRPSFAEVVSILLLACRFSWCLLFLILFLTISLAIHWLHRCTLGVQSRKWKCRRWGHSCVYKEEAGCGLWSGREELQRLVKWVRSWGWAVWCIYLLATRVCWRWPNLNNWD